MISITYDAEFYRKTLNETIRENDTVVEIGPHVGEYMKNYVPRTKLTVAVDKAVQSEKSIKVLENDFKNLRFVRGDVRMFETVKLVLEITKNCDVLCIDMGGGRYPDTVFKVWAVWSGIFEPRDSIIRNRGIGEFVQRAKVIDDSIIQPFEDSGWMKTWGRTVPYELKKQMDEFDFWIKVK